MAPPVQRGTRPIRIANCSGAVSDPGYHMYRQATEGPVDVITGDYLAEANLAWNAPAMAAGQHSGWQQTAWDGLEQTLKVADAQRIKIIINGGALNPKGLAEKTQEKVDADGLNLKVAYISGDDRFLQAKQALSEDKASLPFLDGSSRTLDEQTQRWLDDPKKDKSLITSHAYLGARAIVCGLRKGADIIICGRVADASPVIGAAWWWYDWSDTDYDALAGALVAGHLIECSAYITGANFAGIDSVSMEKLIDVGFGIVEVEVDGSCMVTKHEQANGLVTRDTVVCQFLYELQGHVYLHSDVSAFLAEIEAVEIGPNRVRVSGAKGGPPPPTTKLAIFYHSGYKTEFTVNLTGYGTARKWELFEAQMRHGLAKNGTLPLLEHISFQICGIPQPNAPTQLASTTSMRVYAVASTSGTVAAVHTTFMEYFMQHPAGLHCSLDFRTAAPVPVLAYYPSIIPQNSLHEQLHLLPAALNPPVSVGHPPQSASLPSKRVSYDPPLEPKVSFGPTLRRPLGKIALARSGDKGGNINVGFFIPQSTHDQWQWLRHTLTTSRMSELCGDDWRDEFDIERVEFEKLKAVHFVIYGILGRGVSSTDRLDCLGKGFAEWIRDRWVDVPVGFLSENEEVDGIL